MVIDAGNPRFPGLPELLPETMPSFDYIDKLQALMDAEESSAVDMLTPERFLSRGPSPLVIEHGHTPSTLRSKAKNS